MESEMDLKTVFYVFYLRRRVAKADVRARLKAFNGWNFTAASKHYPKALESLLSVCLSCCIQKKAYFLDDQAMHRLGDEHSRNAG